MSAFLRVRVRVRTPPLPVAETLARPLAVPVAVSPYPWFDPLRPWQARTHTHTHTHTKQQRLTTEQTWVSSS